ncbi:MAG: hypothetical protein IMF26_01515 [Candidatus Fermentithermobacillus carboniphilus]|uniref:Uncharacterized protein n=1 Tax=Candidatus Fermentithermobacillus carboniphilus TaxID=3085328 RepID=A0AAT9LCD6_9FIRM|nr:MAG: hypothetical protein IMF26_01515 [Candidatus Fermentithermobacillus carboniphilus]
MAGIRENVGLVLLALVFIFFCAWKALGWRNLHPSRRLAITVGIVFSLVSIVISAVNPPWAGRWILGTVISAFLGYGLLYSLGRKQHEKTLDSFAAETGMTAVRTPQDEESSKELADLKKWMDRDLYKWKVSGQYPALVQKRGPWTLVVRVPLAVDFDLNAPDYTVFAYIRKIPMNTIIIAEMPLKEKDKPKKIFTTGDPEFDKRYYLTGVSASDALAVFKDEVRDYFKKLTSFSGWVRLERFGIYYYMPGMVGSRDDLEKSIALLDLLAKAVEKGAEEGELKEP